MSTQRNIAPATVAPYFTLVALIHAAAVATRFDALAAKLPPAVAPALMLGQFPLILLSGYFEGRIDYGPTLKDFPLWMRIKSGPVKLAFTFAFIYIACVLLQTLHIKLGPVDPSPPLEWPLKQRALWFGIFTAGMFFPFYLAATSFLIPVLRFITRPLRSLPSAAGALISLVVGGGIGVLVFALVTKTKLGQFVAGIRATIEADPLLMLGFIGVTVFGPMLLGLVLGKREAAD